MFQWTEAVGDFFRPMSIVHVAVLFEILYYILSLTFVLAVDYSTYDTVRELSGGCIFFYYSSVPL
jgi:hypothetical protein